MDIYSGKTTNWKEVGGKDGSIRIIRREEGDSSLEVLRSSFPGFKDITITEKSATTHKDSETCQLAEKKERTIAFGTYANAINYNVTILSIENQKTNEPSYPYTGVLSLIYKEVNKTGSIKDFLDFVKSPEAQEAIKKSGGTPF